jgi:hypothetical protein
MTEKLWRESIHRFFPEANSLAVGSSDALPKGTLLQKALQTGGQ